MTSSNFESVCKELDEMTIRMVQLMKEYIDVKLSLEDIIKTGNFHLAKSRYIMGNKSVSVMQLPTEDSFEFNASTRVSVSNSDDSDVLSMELNRLSLSNLDSVKDVRSRVSKNRSSPAEESNFDEQKPRFQDPMKWFGVLVPQNLRQAQTCYNKAIELAVQSTNIQLEMYRLGISYSEKLMKKKELLKNHV